jgi:hypothetical protein
LVLHIKLRSNSGEGQYEKKKSSPLGGLELLAHALAEVSPQGHKRVGPDHRQAGGQQTDGAAPARGHTILVNHHHHNQSSSSSSSSSSSYDDGM